MTGATTTLVDFSTIDFSAITTIATEGIPYVLPVVVTLVAVRKGISFVMGLIRGA